MSVTSAFRSIAGAFSRQIAAMRRTSQFTCGDCERSDRCGLPPSDTCIIRAEQMARGDWKARRRAKTLLRTVSWVYPS